MDSRTARSVLRIQHDPTAASPQNASRSPSRTRSRASSFYASDDDSVSVGSGADRVKRAVKIDHPAHSTDSWRKPMLQPPPQPQPPSQHANDARKFDQITVAVDPCATLNPPAASAGIDESGSEPAYPASMQPQTQSTPVIVTTAPTTGAARQVSRLNSAFIVTPEEAAFSDASLPVSPCMPPCKAPASVVSPLASPTQRPMLSTQSVPYQPPQFRPRAQTHNVAATLSNDAPTGALSPTDLKSPGFGSTSTGTRYRPPHARMQLNLALNSPALNHLSHTLGGTSGGVSGESSPSSFVSMPSPAFLNSHSSYSVSGSAVPGQQQPSSASSNGTMGASLASLTALTSPSFNPTPLHQQSTTQQLQHVLLQGHRFYRPPASPQPNQLQHSMSTGPAAIAAATSVAANFEQQQQAGQSRSRAETITTGIPVTRAPLTVNWWETPVTSSSYDNFPSPAQPLSTAAARIQTQRSMHQSHVSLHVHERSGSNALDDEAGAPARITAMFRSPTMPTKSDQQMIRPVPVKPLSVTAAAAAALSRPSEDSVMSDTVQTTAFPIATTAIKRPVPFNAAAVTSILSQFDAHSESSPRGSIASIVSASNSMNDGESSSAAVKSRPDLATPSTLREKYMLKIPQRKRPRQLRDFEMLDTLGTGTFGRVYLCRERFGRQDEFFALKVLRKVDVVRLKQVEHINSEKEILAQVEHPFIVNMHATFQDDINLYMMMEYIIGGELFSHLRRAGRFTNEVTRFFAAEIVLALEYLHSKDIVYRDLKPENLLLDNTGHIKITDFGFAKLVQDRTWTLCGTPEYLAPEIIQSKGHGKAVDWWALGILTFEMLAGYPPFFDDNPFGIYEKILSGRLQFPAHFNLHAKDLIRRFLTADRSQRLGNMKGGAADVKEHKWFRGVDWEGLEQRTVKAPIQPKYRHPGDTGNFEKYPPERGDIGGGDTGSDPYRRLFKNF